MRVRADGLKGRMIVTLLHFEHGHRHVDLLTEMQRLVPNAVVEARNEIHEVIRIPVYVLNLEKALLSDLNPNPTPSLRRTG